MSLRRRKFAEQLRMLRDARFGHVGGIDLLLFGAVLVDWHDDEDKSHVATTFLFIFSMEEVLS